MTLIFDQSESALREDHFVMPGWAKLILVASAVISTFILVVAASVCMIAMKKLGFF